MVQFKGRKQSAHKNRVAKSSAQTSYALFSGPGGRKGALSNQRERNRDEQYGDTRNGISLQHLPTTKQVVIPSNRRGQMRNRRVHSRGMSRLSCKKSTSKAPKLSRLRHNIKPIRKRLSNFWVKKFSPALFWLKRVL